MQHRILHTNYLFIYISLFPGVGGAEGWRNLKRRLTRISIYDIYFSNLEYGQLGATTCGADTTSTYLDDSEQDIERGNAGWNAAACRFGVG